VHNLYRGGGGILDSNVVTVGMREFRAHLPQYLFASLPVAITRHGETVGFYIPAIPHPKQTELEALKQAALMLEKLLISHDISEDELLADFRSLREKDKR